MPPKRPRGKKQSAADGDDFPMELPAEATLEVEYEDEGSESDGLSGALGNLPVNRSHTYHYMRRPACNEAAQDDKGKVGERTRYKIEGHGERVKGKDCIEEGKGRGKPETHAQYANGYSL
jgi:hypothetical protein